MRSCTLQRKFQADKLDQQLDRAARSFCSQEIKIEEELSEAASGKGAKVAVVSKIFQW